MAKCGHYGAGGRTSHLVRELGLEYLRCGPPYYADAPRARPVRLGLRRRDLAELRRLRITPDPRPCHFGVPDWVGDFQNPDWPRYFAEYAGAFAERFPWVRFFTPVNEIFVAAPFSAQYGWWNERLSQRPRLSSRRSSICARRTCSPMQRSCGTARRRSSSRANRPSTSTRRPGVEPREAPQRASASSRWTSPTATPSMRDVRVPDGQRHDAGGVPLVHERRPAGFTA